MLKNCESIVLADQFGLAGYYLYDRKSSTTHAISVIITEDQDIHPLYYRDVDYYNDGSNNPSVL
jgi:hypothetical protein